LPLVPEVWFTLHIAVYSFDQSLAMTYIVSEATLIAAQTSPEQ